MILYRDSEYKIDYRHFRFFIENMNDCKRSCRVIVKAGLINRILSYVRLTDRLFRMEPRSLERITEGLFVYSFKNTVSILDVLNKMIVPIQQSRMGFSTVLNFCSDGNNVYWGDYGNNGGYDEVNIYKITKDHIPHIVHSFPKGAVRHIHNVIYDSQNRYFWVLCGDNEDNAGIYKANTDWTQVAPFKTGEQKYRAVVGFPHQGGLLYATDSVETENHLRYIEADGKEQVLTPINGSCIYGTEIKDYYIFSTTVESHEGGGLRNMISTELGGGIKSRDVHLVAVRKSDMEVRVIEKYRKDIWPMKIFQYGTMLFPGGQEQNDDLWFNAMACKGVDGKDLHFIKNEIDRNFF